MTGPTGTGWHWLSAALGVAVGIAAVAAIMAWRPWDRSTAAAPGPGTGLQSAAAGGGPVDVGFLQHMAQHHDQAVVIANLSAGRGTAQTRALAEQIAQGQLYETGEMRGWLKLWARPTLPADRGMAWMTPKAGQRWTEDASYARLCTATGGMPGMASATELDRLRRVEGRALDILFLQLMLRHHLSAIPMARFAARNAETPLVAATAAAMVRDQSEEAAAMRTMLARQGAPELPFPGIDVHIRQGGA